MFSADLIFLKGKEINTWTNFLWWHLMCLESIECLSCWWWGLVRGSTWVWAQEDFLSKLCLFSQAGLKHPHRALCLNKKTRRGRLCFPVRLLTLTMFDLIGGVLDDWGKVPDMFRQRHSNELNARMMPALMFALFFTKFIIIRHQNTVKLMVQEMQTLAV